jgi:hypothetical protein
MMNLEVNVNAFYPLLRNNAINIDPKFFAIYKSFFCHHGAGSRKKKSNMLSKR